MSSKTELSALEKNAKHFLEELFQCVTSYESMQSDMYAYLTTHTERLNAELLAALPVAMSVLLTKQTGQRQTQAVLLAFEFAKVIEQFPLGSPEVNSELGIAAYEQALTVVQTVDPLLPVHDLIVMHLAVAYLGRGQGDRTQNIELAINVYEQLLGKIRYEAISPKWADTWEIFAELYMNRGAGDRAQNIESAITAYRQVLTVKTRETAPTQWVDSMESLAIAYLNRIEGERVQNLETAKNTYQQILTAASSDNTIVSPSELADLKHALATVCTILYETTTPTQTLQVREQQLEEILSLYQEALTVRTRQTAPLEWACSLSGWAMMVYKLGAKGDRAQIIEDTINALQQSLEILNQEETPAEWALAMNCLGNAYSERIRGDRLQNIEDSLEAYRQTLRVITKRAMPDDWAALMNNLTRSYLERRRGDRARNIEAAISAARQSLQVVTRERKPFEWAQTTNNVALAYYDRIHGDSEQNIEKAIALCKQALEIRTRDTRPMEWAVSTRNLGTFYYERIRGDRAHNIEVAIDAYQQAQTVLTRDVNPVEWAGLMRNLALAYQQRVHGEHEQNLETSIAAYEKALNVWQPDRFPKNCRITASLLGDLYAQQNQWAKAADSYAQALQATEILYQSSLFIESQTSELTEFKNLFRKAAYAQAKAGNLSAAVVTIEQGRARGLSDRLERDRADLSTLKKNAPDIYHQYYQAAEALRHLERDERLTEIPLSASSVRESVQEKSLFDSVESSKQAKQVHQAFNAAIELIRSYPSYRDFLRPAELNDILLATKPGQSLVYLLCAEDSGLALVVHKQGFPLQKNQQLNIKPIWLDKLSEETLQTLIFGLEEDAVGWLAAYANRHAYPGLWPQTLDRITKELWPLIMCPLVDYLKSVKVDCAVLVPTDLLSFLPLHIAWCDKKQTPTGRLYALDIIHFTYAPNARTLSACQQIAEKTMATALLAVNEPRPTQKNALPHSEQEVNIALKYFDKHRLLQHKKATRKAILSSLQKYNVLHFSCHGVADIKSPLDSGLLMAKDEILTLRDLFELDFGTARLAVLSACETGLPGGDLLDEAVSLPSGFLQAGVAGVAASLWAVDDSSTMMLMARFYDYWQRDTLTPAEALRKSQQWVRDTTSQEKKDYFASKAQKTRKGWLPAWTRTRDINVVTPPDQNRDLSHPYYWAAFAYIGV